MLKRLGVPILVSCLMLVACKPSTEEPAKLGGAASVQKTPTETQGTPPSGGAAKGDSMPSAGLVKLPSGLEYTILKEGTGPTPKLGSMVTIHVTGWLPDGRVFIDTRAKGIPRNYRLDGMSLISGWVEALQAMKQGEKRKIHVPSRLAYGSAGWRDAVEVVPPNADLDFEMEIVGIGK